mgnify:CR=1 FL=1
MGFRGSFKQAQGSIEDSARLQRQGWFDQNDATRRWPDAKAVHFAEYCRELGADLLLVLPSDNARPQGKIGHYKKVAEVMPLM